jgi:mono/diheme cytochrome c family protein
MSVACGLATTALAAVVFVAEPRLGAVGAQAPADGGELLQATLTRYCVSCHNGRLLTADLTLDGLDLTQVGEHAEVWEAVVAKLRTRAMPPAGRPRPAPETYEQLASWLESEIDRVALANPDPGRPEAVHRLNRAEYANAVRDLLALEVDVDELLPADDFDEYGFDNMADVLTVSSALMERYLSAARKIGRLALGETPLGPAIETYSVPILLLQDDRMGDDLPFGSRGGVGIRHQFPVDGEYDLEIRLHRNYVDYVRGMGSRHELEVRLDGRLVRTFTFGGEEPDVVQAPASYGGNQFGDAAWEEYMLFADANMRVRFLAEAGPHVVGVSFVRKLTEPEGVLQPRQSVFAVAVNEMRDGNAAVEYVAIGGPYASHGPGDTPSRRAIFSCEPASEARADEETCARELLGALARRAYRRPVDTADLDVLMDFYRAGRDDSSFDAGVQLALERVLIAPDFLFRMVRDPSDIAPATAYVLSDLEIASRLSFFLWSSGPDDELLALAEQGRLDDPVVLDQQTRRMLADPRSAQLVRNFVGQWLYLRNLRGVVPDAIAFPEFDENLREAFEQETELFVDSLIRDDRSVLDLLGADYTFLNERLAAHYGIPNVYGSHFRRVSLEAELAERRGGIFGHGSVLTVTSYPNRTSPVLRGKWLLTNILGAPPPPPPADVPDLPDRGEDGRAATVRSRLQRHRESPACAVCHAQMDPLGLALENYDAVGRWRTAGEANLPIDASGTMPDGTVFDGPGGLRALLLARGDQFVGTLVEKLLAYALGRGPEYHDRPTVRAIVRDAASDDYRWSSIITGIVRSTPFRMRRSE